MDADVVGCVRDPTNDSVIAIDTWNDSYQRKNTRDNNQDVTTYNSSFINGRISCTYECNVMPSCAHTTISYRILFAIHISAAIVIDNVLLCRFTKSIVGRDSSLSQDKPLNLPYFIMYGYRSDEINDTTRFPVHGFGADLPLLSHQMLNPALHSNSDLFSTVTAPVRATDIQLKLL